MIVDKNSGLKDSERRNKYQDLTLELKKINEHEDEGDANCYWCALDSHRRICSRTGGWGNKRTGQTETIQTSELLRSDRILRRILEV